MEQCYVNVFILWATSALSFCHRELQSCRDGCLWILLACNTISSNRCVASEDSFVFVIMFLRSIMWQEDQVHHVTQSDSACQDLFCSKSGLLYIMSWPCSWLAITVCGAGYLFRGMSSCIHAEFVIATKCNVLPYDSRDESMTISTGLNRPYKIRTLVIHTKTFYCEKKKIQFRQQCLF